MTTLCQMKCFNFLWLKWPWVQYLLLAPGCPNNPETEIPNHQKPLNAKLGIWTGPTTYLPIRQNWPIMWDILEKNHMSMDHV